MAETTLSLCPTCYREVVAALEEPGDGTLWMTKACPDHGSSRALMEPSADFWHRCMASRGDGSDRMSQVYNELTIITVTDRCNVSCPNCYHQPDRDAADPPADYVVGKVLAMPTRRVCLMGAEPTLRDDLADIIRRCFRLGRNRLSTYTNGIKTADKRYLATLRKAGLFGISVSVHNADYHGRPVHERALQTVFNAHELGLPIGQVAFTVTDSGPQLDQALDTILDLHRQGISCVDYCLRTPAHIGRVGSDTGIYLSDLAAAIARAAEGRGLPFGISSDYANNPYHVSVDFGPVRILTIHWPTAENIDMRMMNMGPYASFLPGAWTSFALQAILLEGVHKGWWQGARVGTAPGPLPALTTGTPVSAEAR